MTKEVLINVGAGEIRVAVVEDGVLDQLWLERTMGFEADRWRRRVAAVAGGGRSVMGDIVLGRVQRVMTGMQAAFVEIGGARAGFLALRDARMLSKKADAEIGDCVREGESVLVQVKIGRASCRERV